MRVLAAAAVAAGLVLGAFAVSAGSAETPGRASATAGVAGGTVGDHGFVAAERTQTSRQTTSVSARGLRIGSGEAVARTQVQGARATAHAEAAARSIDILDGLVTAYGARREMDAGRGSSGLVSGLRVAGDFIGDVIDPASYQLPDGAGTVLVNQGGTALQVVLDEEVDGLPPGTTIRVASVSATAVAGRATPDAEKPREGEPGAEATPGAREAPAERRRRRSAESAADRRRLAAAPMTFPVAGEASIADDWGGPRQIGPHQGNDIFAAFGTPVVAVADGVLEKVGTLPISGNRLWLRSGRDSFFYAHLSVFSPVAASGRRVRAGTVLGYIGNTGDAEPTPPHLHFEIHPGGRRAVDPHEILRAWQARSPLAGGGASAPGALVEVRDFIAGE